ncbi:MAG: hypothetical protein KKG47_07060 [Proteobacteria bacterium]|nr:hypothetical protein [Pseudomonadota bacterium]MBU1739165.1 hypothetical protein [Pseudomonadota bacterium]
MDHLSRLVVVETGRVLREEGLAGGRGVKVKAGLIGGTRYGSLETDLLYAETAAGDPLLASPLLFSYTLPNISLAEAASHFGLTGPVYSVFSENPLSAAEEEALRWLADDPELAFMVAGGFDFRAGEKDAHGQEGPADTIEVNIKVVRK